MPIHCAVNRTVPYVLECDRELPDGAPGKWVFTLATISHRQKARILDLSAGANMDPRIGSNIVETCRGGIRGVSGVTDSKGSPISVKLAPNKDGVLPEGQLDFIPFEHLPELAKAINDLNTLTDDDAKN